MQFCFLRACESSAHTQDAYVQDSTQMVFCLLIPTENNSLAKKKKKHKLYLYLLRDNLMTESARNSPIGQLRQDRTVCS